VFVIASFLVEFLHNTFLHDNKKVIMNVIDDFN